eukprot:m.383810 g.383810  ORF g.383810 m.383810 type:complete len:408 (-) comp20984_c0_seq3:209-1432(-)
MVHTMAALSVVVTLGLFGLTVAQESEPCVCADTWQDNSGSCSGSPVQRHGCPTLAELQECAPTTQNRWCQTTSATCSTQVGMQTGSGIMTSCDITQPAQRAVLQKIANNEKCVASRVQNGSTLLWDLSVLEKKTNPNDPDTNFRVLNYQASLRGKDNADDRDYYINVCAGLADYDDADVAAYEEAPNNGTGTSHVLGRLENSQLISLKDDDLRMQLPDGDPSDHGDAECPARSVDIIFFCQDASCGPAASNNGLGSPVFLDEFVKCKYVFVWNTCAACPLGHPSRENCGGDMQSYCTKENPCGADTSSVSASPGTVIVITVAAFVGVYLVVGVMYNRFVNGARGVEQLPNYSFWGSLCSNIASGPGGLVRMARGRKVNKISQNFHGGLLDDDDDEEDLEDAEDRQYG